MRRFAYRLALAVGTWDVDGMLRGMTAKQFRRWAHYAEVEPFRFDRELRADFRAAQIVTIIANVNRGKGKAYKMQDFLMKFDEEQKPAQKKSWQEMQKLAYMIARIYNAPGVNG